MSALFVTRRMSLIGTGLLASGTARSQPLPALGSAPARASGFAIGSGTTGGVYFPLGRTIAGLLNRAQPDLNAVVVATQGSIENVDALGSGKFSLVFTQVDTAVNAVDGEDHYDRKPLKIRALANLYSGRMQLVTTAKAGIRRMADLKGKRVSTGTPGSGNENMAFRLLKVAAIDRTGDFGKHEFLTPEEGTKRILSGELDAYFFNSGIPTAAIVELGNAPGVELRLVDHAELTEGIAARYGHVYFPEIIPAGTYPRQKADNKQISVGNILAVSEGMPAALVTTVLETIWTSRAALGETHREGTNFALAGQKTNAIGIPWHPAAEAFWRRQGAML